MSADQSTSEILRRAQAYVGRVYTANADERQKAMGLSYVTAEKDDLAREFARFAIRELNTAYKGASASDKT